MPLLSVVDVSLAFGGPRLLDGIGFQVDRGERICLLGRNGEGKSTLLKLIEGVIEPDEGQVLRQSGLRVARLTQDVPEGGTLSVAEEVAGGIDDRDRPASADDYRVEAILSKMGLDAESPVRNLSSGMRRRVLLAKALVAEPDVLLLDEPTNHLDIDSIRWLEETLVRLGVTLIFVTHDRAFLARLATRIVELDRGRIFDWACDYPNFLRRKEDVLAAEARQEALFDKKLAQEEVWIRKGIQARRTRNEGRVRALESMRVARRQRRERLGTAKIQAQEGERSGTLVVEAQDVAFSYGDRPVLRGLSTLITRGDKVGIIGPNGSGKTTLIRLLLGLMPPTSGTIRVGSNQEVAYFDQLKGALDEEKTVQQNVSEYETIPINGGSRHVLGYLQDFLFAPDRARTLVRFLSGGERSRLLLAKLFTKTSNILVLDEPTNDLDVETLDLLGGLLVDYAGTVLLVSHDRAFLNDVATSTLAIEADGAVKEYDGGYDDYLRQRLAEATAAPKAPESRESPSAPPAARARKLSYKERKELDELPGRIEVLETSRREFHERMADPAFYRKDGSEIADVNARLAALEADLAEAYRRWELLEESAG